MKIEVNVEKKYVFLLVGLLLILTFALLAYAYGGTQPTVVGHSFGELENVQYRITNGLTQCSGTNLAIKTIDPSTGVVTCETDNTGSGSPNVVALIASGSAATSPAGLSCTSGVRVGCSGGGMANGGSTLYVPVSFGASGCSLQPMLVTGAQGTSGSLPVLYTYCLTIS